MKKFDLYRTVSPEKIKILYLAQYAPTSPDYKVKQFAGDGTYPEYHYNIYKALLAIGFNVVPTSSTSSLLSAKGNVDYVFSLFNRMPINNSEIFVSATCEYLRLPYLGSRPSVRALAEDKLLTKLVATSLQIPVPRGTAYKFLEPGLEPPSFGGPYIVKDRFGAGSEDFHEENLQDSWDGARKIVEELRGRGKDALVEEFSGKIDVTIPVLGGDPFLILGYVHPLSNRKGNIFTHDLKLEDRLGYDLFEPSDDLRVSFYSDIEKIWSFFGPIDYFRLDYRVDPGSMERKLLEINICCHIGQCSTFTLTGESYDINHLQILDHIVAFSLKRQATLREHLEWIL